MYIYVVIIEALVLSTVLSMDAFVASFAYGSKNIKMPVSSIFVINIICSLAVGSSFLLGALVKNFIPVIFAKLICFLLLFALGMSQLLDSATKSIIRRYGGINKDIKFSFSNFKFVLSLYADPENADVDNSKVISVSEASSLALAVSLDGIAVGFGAALGSVSGLAVFLCSFLTNTLAVVLGIYLGNKMAKKLKFNVSWLSGIILIVLAILKLN